jgi:hexulose-6-phosphate isomerase
MKKAINIWSFPAAWDLARKLELAAQAGFAGFEPDLSENGPIHLGSTEAELSAVRTLAENLGLQFSGLATGLYWGANAASGDSAVRERAAHVLRRQIECAAALGIDTVLVIPGVVGADFLPDAEPVPYDVAYDRARAFIGAAVPLAARHRVHLAIENVWNKFLLSPLEMRAFIDSFGSEWVGSYLDVGNVLASGYPEHWISILGPRIRRVHFKDFRRAFGTIHGFVELLSGDVHWPAVVAALRSVDYTGWVAAEMIPPIPFYKHHPEVLIGNASRAMDAILGAQGMLNPNS